MLAVSAAFLSSEDVVVFLSKVLMLQEIFGVLSHSNIPGN